MFKNCVFKNSVDTRKWMVNAGIRAVKTMAQTAVAVMGTSTVLSAIDWRMVLSSAVVAGLPEAPCEGISSEEAKK